jgi:hypothetical protein
MTNLADLAALGDQLRAAHAQRRERALLPDALAADATTAVASVAVGSFVPVARAAARRRRPDPERRAVEAARGLRRERGRELAAARAREQLAARRHVERVLEQLFGDAADPADLGDKKTISR